MKTNAGNIVKGQYIRLDGNICAVVTTEHNFRGRGSATIRLKVKNLINGSTVEHTFRPSELIEVIDIDSVQLQYLYADDKVLHFMDDKTYEQYEVSKTLAGDYVSLFKQGEQMYVLLYDNHTIAIRPPLVVRLKVTIAQDAVKGDTATAARKEVTVETGATIKVPLFIKKGDTIAISTETGQYLERSQ